MNRTQTLTLSIPLVAGVVAAACATAFTAAVGAALDRAGPVHAEAEPAGPATVEPVSQAGADHLFAERMIARHRECIAEIEASLPNIHDESLKLAAADLLDAHRRNIERISALHTQAVRTASARD